MPYKVGAMSHNGRSRWNEAGKWKTPAKIRRFGASQTVGFTAIENTAAEHQLELADACRVGKDLCELIVSPGEAIGCFPEESMRQPEVLQEATVSRL